MAVLVHANDAGEIVVNAEHKTFHVYTMSGKDIRVQSTNRHLVPRLVKGLYLDGSMMCGWVTYDSQVIDKEESLKAAVNVLITEAGVRLVF